MQKQSFFNFAARNPIAITIANKTYNTVVQLIEINDIPTLDPLKLITKTEDYFFDGKLFFVIPTKNGLYEILQPINTWLPSLLYQSNKYLPCAIFPENINKEELVSIKEYLTYFEAAKHNIKPQEALDGIFSNKRLQLHVNRNYRGKQSATVSTSLVEEYFPEGIISPSTIQRIRSKYSERVKRKKEKEQKENSKKSTKKRTPKAPRQQKSFKF